MFDRVNLAAKTASFIGKDPNFDSKASEAFEAKFGLPIHSHMNIPADQRVWLMCGDTLHVQQ